MIYKKFFLLSLLLMGSTLIAQPQKVYNPPSDVGPTSVSIKTGIGISGLTGDLIPFNLDNSISISMHLHIVTDKLNSRTLEFPGEVGFTFKSARIEYPEEAAKFGFHSKTLEYGSFEFNPMIKYKFNEVNSSIFIVGGISLSILVNGSDLKFFGKKSISGIVEEPNWFDYALFIGIGYDFGEPSKGKNQRQFGIEVRYTHGLNEIYPGIKNQLLHAQLRLYLFHL